MPLTIGDNMNIYDLAGVNEREAMDLEYKINDSLDLSEFTDREHRLIYQLAGADLLNSSTTRGLVMLYAKNIIQED